MTGQPTHILAVLLHADVVGSIAIVQINETLAHQGIQDTFRRFSATITRYNGIAREIRGDALVAEFARASDAVSASLASQAAEGAQDSAPPDDVSPAQRIGIAMGEVVVADNTVTGEGVVLAQRLEKLAAPGGVRIQGAARDTVPRRLPFGAVVHGERALTLSPNYPGYYLGHLANAYRLAGRTEEAIAALKAWHAREPGFGLTDLVIVLQQIGQLEDAKATARDLLSIRREFTISAWTSTQFRAGTVGLEADIEALRAAGLPMR